ncbi:MAG TPA: condensation domain-containing protein [Anaerolineales bacterium]|nr:condensation domain-containing protein [Anaerolineales bacterium]
MKRELGIFERGQFVADHYAPFHIVSVLRLEGKPRPHILRKSFLELQKRHPFLSVRLMHENERYYFATLIDPSLSLRITPRWNDDHWIQVTETELSTRMDASSGPPFRCTYLYNENQQRAEIILSISHFIADAASTSQLMHELMIICASFSDRTPVSVSELSPAPPLESRFAPGFKGWRLNLRILRYALSQMADEIFYRFRTIGKRTPPFHKRASRGRILPVQFSSDLLESFSQRARKEGVTLNSALNAALLRSVNRHLYAGEKLPMRTFSFADLRPHVQPPLHAENLGCYISMMRYTVDVGGEGDFWPLAKKLHKKIYASLKGGDKFVASAMSESLLKMLVKFDSMRLCASAVNYNGVGSMQTKYGNMKVFAVHGFVSAHAFGPEMASQAQLFNDQLFWDFAYLEEDMNEEKAKAIVEEVKGIMISVIV